MSDLLDDGEQPVYFRMQRGLLISTETVIMFNRYMDLICTDLMKNAGILKCVHFMDDMYIFSREIMTRIDF